MGRPFARAPQDVLTRAVERVQRRMRERALERGGLCYLCGVRVKRFRIFRPQIEQVHTYCCRADPANWRLAHAICNNLKGTVSDPLYYGMLVAHRIAWSELVAPCSPDVLDVAHRHHCLMPALRSFSQHGRG